MPESLIVIILLIFFGYIGIQRLAYLLALLALFLPAYVLRFMIGPIPLVGQLPTTLLEIMVIALFISVLTNSDKQIRQIFSKQLIRTSPLKWLPILLLATAVASTIISPDSRAAFGIAKAYFFEPILAYYLLVALFQTPRLQQAVNSGLLGSMLWISLLAIAQYIFRFGLHIGFDDPGHGRVLAVFNTPNAIGLYLAPLLAFFLPSFITALGKNRANSNKHYRLLLLATIPLSLITIYLSYSRGAWLGLIVALLLYLIVTKGKKVILPLCVSVALCTLTLFVFVPRFQNFFTTTGNPADMFGDNSANVRINIYQRTWTMLRDRPLTGAGLAGFQSWYSQYDVPAHEEIPLYPHNIILNFWSELGLYGLVIFSAIVIASWHSTRSKPSSRDHPCDETNSLLAINLFLITLLVHGLVDVPYFKNDLALMFWIVLAQIPISQNGKRKLSR